MPTTVNQETVEPVVKAEVEKIEKIIGKPLKIVVTVRERPSHHDFQLSFQLADAVNGGLVASFKLNQLHGQCGVVVSNATVVTDNHRRKGVGTILQTIKELVAKHCDYSQMLATTNLHNEYQERILRKYGWYDVPMLAFRNKRSGNNITIWGKRIA